MRSGRMDTIAETDSSLSQIDRRSQLEADGKRANSLPKVGYLPT